MLMKATKFIAMTLQRETKQAVNLWRNCITYTECRSIFRNIQAVLVQITMTKGTEDYQREAAVFSNIPYIILGISIVFMVAAVWLTKILSILLQSLF